jgi:hypothetical protein
MDAICSLRDVAQPRCDDVVLAAAVFAPNAAGRRELSCVRGMSERQVLKSRGAYFAERVLIAITPIEVVAVAMGALSARFRSALFFRRDRAVIRSIPSRRGAHLRAFLLAVPDQATHLELAQFTTDGNTRGVVDQLLAIGRNDIVHH